MVPNVKDSPGEQVSQGQGPLCILALQGCRGKDRNSITERYRQTRVILLSHPLLIPRHRQPKSILLSF
ncbi:hypothetical protein CEXT_615401 [Caerostris extrusa]|uniref:Uncharacterized protein n=1 Tax=Caerostris extrusa TaxID=172846 RepID=A0AAV4YC22_CAEEX|nr:hypothetical protein CEXT_615401 [Caerostris extrusa]